MKPADFLSTPADAPAVYLRERSYTAAERGELVRDVMSLANAAWTGSRFIALGVRPAASGNATLVGVAADAAAALERELQGVAQCLEPALQLRVHSLDGAERPLVVIEILACDKPPYLLTTLLGEGMAPGCCWVREAGQFRPAARADFDRMYGVAAPAATPQTPPTAAPAATQTLQLGFGRDPACRECDWRVRPLDQPPSVVAATQLKRQIESAQIASTAAMEDSLVARLVHAQQYGTDTPYDERGINTLVESYNAVENEYAEADRYYYQEENALKLNFSLANPGQQMLDNVRLTLKLPRTAEFAVVTSLCPPPGSGMSSHEADLLGYPQVREEGGAVLIEQHYERLPAGGHIKAFESALRIVVQPAMAGSAVTLAYSMTSPRLNAPVTGQLKLNLVA